jgi:two-component system, chemotaxis family, protein-glutamate methylesterase/glutaminase
VHVRSGLQRGLICFRQGEIIHAETGNIEGEEAFYQILSWELGSFDSDEESPRAETIQENWDFLLMESMRRLETSG